MRTEFVHEFRKYRICNISAIALPVCYIAHWMYCSMEWNILL